MIQRGDDPPRQYFERPLIDDVPHLQIIFRAFSDLASERSFGMGPGPIPRSVVRDYVLVEMDYLGEDDSEQMIQTLRAIDDGWLRLQTEAPEPEVEEGANDPESPDRKAHPVGRLLKNISKKQKTTKKRG